MATTPQTDAARQVAAIQRRLERWELTHLRALLPITGALAIMATIFGMQVLDGEANANAARLHVARAVQIDQQRIERTAQAVCEDSHGPNAAHWWDGPVLVCAAEQRATTVASTGARP